MGGGTGLSNICLGILLPGPASARQPCKTRHGVGSGVASKVEEGMCLQLLSLLALSSRLAADAVRLHCHTLPPAHTHMPVRARAWTGRAERRLWWLLCMLARMLRQKMLR